ncbi:MAG TPA: ATP-binding protein [Devosia sp.]|nr:ATP-binding protein [Devosia sp.]
MLSTSGIAISNIAIRVEVGRDGSLCVAGDGPGVAAEHRESIFEPFNRVEPLEQGAGLGLNLVRDLSPVTTVKLQLEMLLGEARSLRYCCLWLEPARC